ncbi:MAG: PD-(D/E)XK motif protein, partial [Anaerovoracaceae bacterium]
WLKLLDHKHSALLGINAQKGLIGELLFLKEQIELGTQPTNAVLGWVGPDGADQDFVYNDGWHEIKSTGVSSTSVSISSVEQLDCDNNGELVVYRIDKCAPAQAGAFTLYGLIHSMFNILSKEVGTLDEFVFKLGSAGYIDMTDYDKQNFVFSSKQAYRVDNSFPRLRRNEVPTEVISAEYQLSIPSIASWAK